ncbi:MAG: hypothetical protein NVS1B4_00660 [Gemmatimonadaceae bacterium]
MTTPSLALCPRETTEVRDAVASAVVRKTPLRIAGGGTWLDAGRTLSSGLETLSLAELRGIIDHVPGDLTLTCRSGTTLAEIDAAARAERQWLALDPFGSTDGTIGATVSTASSGPHAHAFGGPRDNVLGVEFVDGTGAVVRGGGRVVKNVAGFDLTRLVTGSWGTLGVVTEVTVRLRAVPESERTLLVSVGGGWDLREALSGFRGAATSPWAAELVDARLASLLDVGRDCTLLVHLGGNEDSVNAQQAALAAVGDVAEASGALWTRLRGCEAARSAVVRFSGLPAEFLQVWTDARRFAEAIPGSFVHATPGRAIARCVMPPSESASLAHALSLVPDQRRRVYERMPTDFWRRFSPTVVGDRLSSRLKRAFDPANVLNPGILGDIGL